MSTMYQEYKNRVQFKGASKRAYVNKKVEESIDSLIYDSQYGFTITKDGQNYDVAILSTSSTQDYERANIIAHNKVGLDRGSLFEWNKENWIVLQKMFRPEQPGFNGYAYKCTGELKWIDENGKLWIRPGYISSGRTTNSLTYTPDINYKFDNVFLHDTDWSMIAAIQQDLSLHNEMRFIIKGHAYRVTNIDNVSIDNVSILSMVDDKLMDSDLIFEDGTGVAGGKETYCLRADVVDQIKLYAGDIKEIPVSVTKDGQLVNEEIIYESLTPEIIDIDDTRLVGRGTGIGRIKCSLKKNPYIFIELEVEVSEEHKEDVAKIYIEGSDYIKWNSTEVYTLTQGLQGTFSVEWLTGVKHTYEITDTQVTISIKDKYAGTVRIICECNGETLTKDVYIKTA